MSSSKDPSEEFLADPDFGQVEMAPAVVEQLFGDNTDKIRQYAGHLADTGVTWGLLGPRELPRLWTRHILNCAVVSSLLNDDDNVADLGSGAGLPGLVLAISNPGISMTLIEPLQRRTDWLSLVVDELDLRNVRVIRARAEDLVDEELFTVVLSRAVKGLPTLGRWTAPLLSVGGRMLALKGERAQDELDKGLKELRKVGLRNPRLHVLGQDQLEVPTRVVELVRA